MVHPASDGDVMQGVLIRLRAFSQRDWRPQSALTKWKVLQHTSKSLKITLQTRMLKKHYHAK